MKNLEVQMGQLATSMKSQQQGKFPSDTEINPKEHCKAITLRSGKQIGESLPEEEKNSTPETETDQMVAEQETEETQKAHKPHSISFPDNPPIKPPLPFPQRFQKTKFDTQFAKFLEIFKKIHINIPFADALEQMPNYAKFMKDVMSKKRKLEEYETVKLTEKCSAILQKKLPQKRKDPGSFTIPCTIGGSSFDKALCDLGASINLMPLSIFKKLGLGEVKPTTVTLQLADRSLTYPRGIVEDVLVKVDKFIFPADFVVLDMEEDQEIPLILGRPFLATGRALIDVQGGQLTLRVNDKEVMFNIYQAMKFPDDASTCYRVDFIESTVTVEKFFIEDPLEHCMICSVTKDAINTLGENTGSTDLVDCILAIESSQTQDEPSLSEDIQQSTGSDGNKSNEDSKVELKQLPNHLRYAFLEDNSTYPVIISSSLTTNEEDKLLRILRKHKASLGWSIADIKGISPTICMHKILMEDSYKPSIEHQRRLNLAMKEVVRAEILKLLKAWIIFAISDSEWVSPVQVVPKKGGMTIIKNENNEMIPTRTVTGWRVCINCRKLNKATR